MSFELRFRVEAKLEILESQEWYDRQEEGLGDRFLDELWQCLDRIADNPYAYPVVYRELHRALVHVFPFAVHFKVESSRVLVYSCFRCSRDPRHWQSRDEA